MWFLALLLYIFKFMGHIYKKSERIWVRLAPKYLFALFRCVGYCHQVLKRKRNATCIFKCLLFDVVVKITVEF